MVEFWVTSNLSLNCIENDYFWELMDLLTLYTLERFGRFALTTELERNFSSRQDQVFLNFICNVIVRSNLPVFVNLIYRNILRRCNMEATVRSQIFRKRIVVRLVIDNKKLMDLFEFAEHFRNLRRKEPGLVLDGELRFVCTT